jgi:homoserine dehydrogenase
MKVFNVGLVGLGTIGTGVAKILLEQGDALIERTGVRLRLKRIVDVDLRRDRGIRLPKGLLTDDLDSILRDPEIACGVELVGGVGVARDIIEKLIDAGKSVVTANKALLAEFGPAILKRAAEKGVSVGFEASVCGGIPIILAIRDGLVANRIESIVAIVNGTANFILTSMKKQGLSYAQALARAQALGYAEADPSLDVEGGDSAHKLVILSQLAFGVDFDLHEVLTEGITRLDASDMQYAAELGYEVKLLAIGRRREGGVELRVHPALIPQSHPLAWVDGPRNAVLVTGDNVGPLLFEGQGAGQMCTASAVVSDLVDAALGKTKITFESFRFLPGRTRRESPRPVTEHQGSYYLRFSAVDRAGVLAQIAGCLGRHGISILSVVQKEARGGKGVPIVMMTDVAAEGAFRQAISEIDRLDCIQAGTVWIRVERGPQAQ